MSEIPGYTLEKYLMWEFDLIVDDDDSANISLSYAERLGTAVSRRKRMSSELFAQVVAIFEEYRGMVEDRLADFDHQECGWRQYAGTVFYGLFEQDQVDAAVALIKTF